MPGPSATLRTGRGLPRRRGVISGYLWKLIRESLGTTQSQLAEYLEVDVTTVQGWESGRRPLPAVSSGEMIRLRVRLIRAGADPRLFPLLQDAFEADVVIDEAVDRGFAVGDSRSHPLSATVHRRELTNFITWPLTGAMPTQLEAFGWSRPSRRGPVPHHPVLGYEERRRLFEHLLALADSCRTEEDHLLRRQAIYLLAFDEEPGTRQWLAEEHERALRSAGRVDDVRSWVSVRSAAVALARSGDRDPLQRFVTGGLSNEDREVANLNYWAYWLGEVAGVRTDDAFMLDRSMRWEGGLLLDHLIRRLRSSADQVELYVHTMWRLLSARPHVLDRHAGLRQAASSRVAEILDDAGLSSRARGELSNVAYAIKIGNGR